MSLGAISLLARETNPAWCPGLNGSTKVSEYNNFISVHSPNSMLFVLNIFTWEASLSVYGKLNKLQSNFHGMWPYDEGNVRSLCLSDFRVSLPVICKGQQLRQRNIHILPKSKTQHTFKSSLDPLLGKEMCLCRKQDLQRLTVPTSTPSFKL